MGDLTLRTSLTSPSASRQVDEVRDMVSDQCPHCGESVVFDTVLWVCPTGFPYARARRFRRIKRKK